jgi:ABC-type multidrug transport system fused ATPase/permease subunit
LSQIDFFAYAAFDSQLWGEGYDDVTTQSSELGSQVAVRNTLPNPSKHPLFYIGGYALLMVAGILVNATVIIINAVASIRASRNLFSQLFSSIMRATFRWHDTTPQGEGQTECVAS